MRVFRQWKGIACALALDHLKTQLALTFRVFWQVDRRYLRDVGPSRRPKHAFKITEAQLRSNSSK
jgi:hypothetical protein